jgi:hypothetical protein
VKDGFLSTDIDKKFPSKERLKKTIVIYSQSDLSRDPRVHRQIEALSNKFRIIAFGNYPPAIPVEHFYDISELMGRSKVKNESYGQIIKNINKYGYINLIKWSVSFLLKNYSPIPSILNIWNTFILGNRVLRRVKMVKPDLIIANDLTSLSLCVNAKGKSKLIYDAHEFSPGQSISSKKNLPRRMYARYVLHKYLSYCDQFITVSEGISKLYNKLYYVNPVIITNAPAYLELSPCIRCDGKIKLVHHGVAVQSRGLELMIETVCLLDERFTLDLFLVKKDKKYYDHLKSIAHNNKRIIFNNPIPMLDIPKVLNNYDLGFWFIKPNCINMRFSLPNKFFDFIQARIALAMGPNFEAKAYNKKYRIGTISEDFTARSMSDKLTKLSLDDISSMKFNVNACAFELSSESNMKTLKNLVENLIGT